MRPRSAEHAAYVAALEAAGVAVTVLEPLEAFPDSVFVEDPA
jgi:dimethylargininase